MFPVMRRFAHNWILFLAILSICVNSSLCQNEDSRIRPGAASYPRRTPVNSGTSNRRQRLWAAQVDYAIHRLDNDFGLLKSAMSNMERRLTMTLSAALAERLEGIVQVTDGHETDIREAVKKLRALESEVTSLKIANDRKEAAVEPPESSETVGEIQEKLQSIGEVVQNLNSTVSSHAELVRESRVIVKDHEERIASLRTSVDLFNDDGSRYRCALCEVIQRNLTNIHVELALHDSRLSNISLLLERKKPLDDAAGQTNESSDDTKSYEYGGVAMGEQVIHFEIYDDYAAEQNAGANRNSSMRANSLPTDDVDTVLMNMEDAITNSVKDLSAKLDTVFVHLLSQQNLLENLTEKETVSSRRFHIFDKRFENISAAFRRAEIRNTELNGGMRSNRRMLEGLAKSFREVFQDDRRQKLAIVNLRRRIRYIESVDFDAFPRRTEFEAVQRTINKTLQHKDPNPGVKMNEARSLIAEEISKLSIKVEENSIGIQSLSNIPQSVTYLETEMKSFSPDIQSISRLRDDVSGLINLRSLVLRNSGDVNLMHETVNEIRTLIANVKNDLLEVEAKINSIKDSTADMQTNQEDSRLRVEDLDASLADIRNQFTRFDFLVSINFTRTSESVAKLDAVDEGLVEEFSDVKLKLHTLSVDLENHKRHSEENRASSKSVHDQVTNQIEVVKRSVRKLDESVLRTQTETYQELHTLVFGQSKHNDSIIEMRAAISDIQTVTSNLKQNLVRQDFAFQYANEQLGYLKKTVDRNSATIDKTGGDLRQSEYATTRLNEKVSSLENQATRFMTAAERWEPTWRNVTLAARRDVLQNYERLQTIDQLMRQVVNSVRKTEKRFKTQEEELKNLFSRSGNQSLAISTLRQRLRNEDSDSNTTRQMFQKIIELGRITARMKHDIKVSSVNYEEHKSKLLRYEDDISAVQSSVWQCENVNREQTNLLNRLEIKLNSNKGNQRAIMKNLRDAEGKILELQQTTSSYGTSLRNIRHDEQDLSYEVHILRNLAESAINGTRETKSFANNLSTKVARLTTEGYSLSSALNNLKEEVMLNTEGRRDHSSKISAFERRFSELGNSMQTTKTSLRTSADMRTGYLAIEDRFNRLSSLVSKFGRKSSENAEFSALLYNQLNSTVYRMNALQVSFQEEHRRKFTRENEFISNLNQTRKDVSDLNSTIQYNERRVSEFNVHILNLRETVDNLTFSSQIYRRKIDLDRKLEKNDARSLLYALSAKTIEAESDIRNLKEKMVILRKTSEQVSIGVGAIEAEISSQSANFANAEHKIASMEANFNALKTGVDSAYERFNSLLFSEQNATTLIEEQIRNLETKYDILSSRYSGLNISSGILQESLEVQRMYTSAIRKKLGLQSYLHGELVKEIYPANIILEEAFILNGSDGTFYSQDVDSTSKLFLSIIYQYRAQKARLENLSEKLDNSRQSSTVYERDVRLIVSEMNETLTSRSANLDECIRGIQKRYVKLAASVQEQEINFTKIITNASLTLTRQKEDFERIIRNADKAEDGRLGMVSSNISMLYHKLFDIESRNRAEVLTIESRFEENITNIRQKLMKLQLTHELALAKVHGPPDLLNNLTTKNHSHTDLDVKLWYLEQTLFNISEKLSRESDEITKLTGHVLKLRNRPESQTVNSLGICGNNTNFELCHSAIKSDSSGERRLDNIELFRYLLQRVLPIPTLASELVDIRENITSSVDDLNNLKGEINRSKKDLHTLDKSISDLRDDISFSNDQSETVLNSLLHKIESQDKRMTLLGNQLLTNIVQINNAENTIDGLNTSIGTCREISSEILQNIATVTKRILNIEVNENGIIEAVKDNTQKISANALKYLTAHRQCNESILKLQLLIDQTNVDMKDEFAEVNKNTFMAIMNSADHFNKSLAKQHLRLVGMDQTIRRINVSGSAILGTLSRQDSDITNLRALRRSLVKEFKNLTDHIGVAEFKYAQSPLNVGKCLDDFVRIKSNVGVHLAHIHAHLTSNSRSLSELASAFKTFENETQELRIELDKLNGEKLSIQNGVKSISRSLRSAETAIGQQRGKVEVLELAVFDTIPHYISQIKNMYTQTNLEILEEFQNKFDLLNETSKRNKRVIDWMRMATEHTDRNYAVLSTLVSRVEANLSMHRRNLQSLSKEFKFRLDNQAQFLVYLKEDTKSFIRSRVKPLIYNISSNAETLNFLANKLEQLRGFMRGSTFKRELLGEIIENINDQNARIEDISLSSQTQYQMLENYSTHIETVRRNHELSLEIIGEKLWHVEIENDQQKKITERHGLHLNRNRANHEVLRAIVKKIEEDIFALSSTNSFLLAESEMLNESLSFLQVLTKRHNKEIGLLQFEQRSFVNLHNSKMENVSITVAELGTQIIARGDRMERLETHLSNLTMNGLVVEQLLGMITEMALHMSNSSDKLQDNRGDTTASFLILNNLNATFQNHIHRISSTLMEGDKLRQDLRENVTTNTVLLDKMLDLIAEVQSKQETGYSCLDIWSRTTEDQRAKLISLTQKVFRLESSQRRQNYSAYHFQDLARQRFTSLEGELASARNEQTGNDLLAESNREILENFGVALAELQSGLTEELRKFQMLNMSNVDVKKEIKNISTSFLLVSTKLSALMKSFEVLSSKEHQQKISFDFTIRRLSRDINDFNRTCFACQDRLRVFNAKLNLFTDNISRVDNVQQHHQKILSELQRMSQEQTISSLHDKVKSLISKQEDVIRLATHLEREQNVTETKMERLHFHVYTARGGMESYAARLERQEQKISNITEEFSKTYTESKGDIRKLKSQDREIQISLLNSSILMSSLVEKLWNQTEKIDFLAKKLKSYQHDITNEMATLSIDVNKEKAESSILRRKMDDTQRETDSLVAANTNISFLLDDWILKTRSFQSEFAVETRAKIENMTNKAIVSEKMIFDMNQHVLSSTKMNENRWSSVRLEMSLFHNRSETKTAQCDQGLLQLNAKMEETRRNMELHNEKSITSKIEVESFNRNMTERFNSVEEDLWNLRNHSFAINVLVEKHSKLVQNLVVKDQKMKELLAQAEKNISQLRINDEILRNWDNNLSAVVARLSTEIHDIVKDFAGFNRSLLINTERVQDSIGSYHDIAEKTEDNNEKVTQLQSVADEFTRRLQEMHEMLGATTQNLSDIFSSLENHDRKWQFTMSEVQHSVQSLGAETKRFMYENRKRMLSNLEILSGKLEYQNRKFHSIEKTLDDTVDNITSQQHHFFTLEQRLIEQRMWNDEKSGVMRQISTSQENILVRVRILKRNLEVLQNDTSRCLIAKDRHENFLEKKAVEAVQTASSLEDINEKIVQLSLDDTDLESELDDTTALLRFFTSRLNNHSEAIQLLGEQTERDNQGLLTIVKNLSYSFLHLSESDSTRWTHLQGLEEKLSSLFNKETDNYKAISQIFLSLKENERSISELQDLTEIMKQNIKRAEEDVVTTKEVMTNLYESLSHSIVAVKNHSDGIMQEGITTFVTKTRSNSNALISLEEKVQELMNSDELHLDLIDALTGRIDETANDVKVQLKRIRSQAEVSGNHLSQLENKTFNTFQNLQHSIDVSHNRTWQCIFQNERHKKEIVDHRLSIEGLGNRVGRLRDIFESISAREQHLSSSLHNNSQMLNDLTRHIQNNTEYITLISSNHKTEYILCEERMNNLSIALDGVAMYLFTNREQVDRMQQDLSRVETNCSSTGKRLQELEHTSNVLVYKVINITKIVSISDRKLTSASHQLHVLNQTIQISSEEHHERLKALTNVWEDIFSSVTANVTLTNEILKIIQPQIVYFKSIANKQRKQINKTAERVDRLSSVVHSLNSYAESQDYELNETKTALNRLNHHAKTSFGEVEERFLELHDMTTLLQSTTRSNQYVIQQLQIEGFDMFTSLEETRNAVSNLTHYQAPLVMETRDLSSSLSALKTSFERQKEEMWISLNQSADESKLILDDIKTLTAAEISRDSRVDAFTDEIVFALNKLSYNFSYMDEFREQVMKNLNTLGDQYHSVNEVLGNMSMAQTEAAVSLENRCDNLVQSWKNLNEKHGILYAIVIENKQLIASLDGSITNHTKRIESNGVFESELLHSIRDFREQLAESREMSYQNNATIVSLAELYRNQQDASASLQKDTEMAMLEIMQKFSFVENRTAVNSMTLIDFAQTLYEFSDISRKAKISRHLLLEKIENLNLSVINLEEEGVVQVQDLKSFVENSRNDILVNVANGIRLLNSSWLKIFENLFLESADAKGRCDILEENLKSQDKANEIFWHNITKAVNLLKHDAETFKRITPQVDDHEARINAAEAKMRLLATLLEDNSGKLEVFSSLQERLSRTVGFLGRRIGNAKNDTFNSFATIESNQNQIREQNYLYQRMVAKIQDFERKLTLLIEFHHGNLSISVPFAPNSDEGIYTKIVRLVSTVREDVSKLNYTALLLLQKRQSVPISDFGEMEYVEYGTDTIEDSITEEYFEQYTGNTRSNAAVSNLLASFSNTMNGIESILLFAVPKTSELFSVIQNEVTSIKARLAQLEKEIGNIKDATSSFDIAENEERLLQLIDSNDENTNQTIHSLKRNLEQRIDRLNSNIVSESERSTLLLEQILPFMEVQQQGVGTTLQNLNDSLELLKQSHDLEISRTDLLIDDVYSLKEVSETRETILDHIQENLGQITSAASQISSRFDGVYATFNQTIEGFETHIELLKRGGERRDALLVNAEKMIRHHSAGIAEIKQANEGSNSLLSAVAEENKWNGIQIDTCIENVDELNREYSLFAKSIEASLNNQSSNIQFLSKKLNDWDDAAKDALRGSRNVLPEAPTVEAEESATAKVHSPFNFNIVTANPTSLVLNWTAFPSSAVTGYKIFIREAELAKPIVIDTAGTQTVVGGLAPSTSFLVEICAIGAGGTLLSDPLTGVAVTAPDTMLTTPAIIPSPRSQVTPQEPDTISEFLWRCDFEIETPCDISQSTSDTFNWQLHNGSTPSENTGPTVDHTRGNSQGRYFFIEASRPRQSGDIARVAISLQPAVEDACLQFYTHMFGVGVGDLSVILSTERGRESRLWQLSGSQENLWQKQVVQIHSDERFYLIFEAVRGPDYHGDIAIDDILLKKGRCPRPAFECDFEKTSICGFMQDSTDDFDWDRNNGATSSSDTGPMTDHTTGTLEGYYMFMESSNPRVVNERTRLVGPELSSTNTQCLQFFYHMHGVNIHTLNVHVKFTQGETNKLLWTKYGPQGNDWNIARVEITSLGSYRLIFEAIRGDDFQGDIAIDDVAVYEGSCSVPSCAIGKSLGNLCYEIKTDARSFDDASDICRANGGQLAIIKTDEQQQFIKGLISADYENWSRFWIGLDDRRREGHFVYSDGTPLAVGRHSFNAWASMEPSDSDGSENCVGIDIAFKNRRWSDITCDVEIGYVCQYTSE